MILISHRGNLNNIDPENENNPDYVNNALDQGFNVEIDVRVFKNKLYLGRTIEYTETNNLVPMLEGRSSIGRLGLFVHVTAGFGDVGFKGFWTLEIFCVQPIRIYAGVEICQLFYHTIDGDYDTYSKGKYQKNSGIQTSKLYEEFNED